MIALTENPAVLAPRKTLTPSQQDALVSIGFYKSQRAIGDKVLVGRKRFTKSTIATLQHHKLLRGDVPALAPTEAGALAIARLRGELR